MMLTFLGFNFIFNQQPHIWMDVGLMFVYYGLYYGVLGRDISEICTDKMAVNVGVIQCFNSVSCTINTRAEPLIHLF